MNNSLATDLVHDFQRQPTSDRFSLSRLRQKQSRGQCSTDPDNGPILLFGMPRSGTTWVGKLFDSHPDTLYRHEPDSVERLHDVPLAANPYLASRYATRLRRYIDSIAQMRHPKTSGQLPLFAKNYQLPGAHKAQQLWVMSGKCAERLRGHWLVPPFCSKASLLQARLVWKSIESLSRIGVVLNAQPSARCVLILRHPCGQIASRLTGANACAFDSAVAAENDWGVFEQLIDTESAKRHGLTRQALERMAPEERLAWNWVLVNEKALDDIAALGLSRRVHVLAYEDLCAQPEAVLRQLFTFVGLKWHSQCEDFINLSTGKHKEAYYSVIKNPQKAANSWKSKLSAGQIGMVEAVLQKSRLASHYPPSNG